MEIHVAPLVKLMSKFSRHEPVVRDSTYDMAFKTCPRLGFLKLVLGFRPKETKPYFSFGICYHKFREILQNELMKGSSDQNAVLAALNATMALWKKIGTEPDVNTQWDFLTGARLIASCQKAAKHVFAERQQGNIKVLATEQPFQVYLSDNKTLIGGRADQIVLWNGKLWGRDFKTTSKMGKFYDRTLEPNDQFTRYTLGESKLQGTRVQGQIVEVLYNSKKEGPEIHPKISSRTEEQLVRWENDMIEFGVLLDYYRTHDYYPMFEKQCPFCEFHSVCKQPTESGMMAQLESRFEQRPWDFYSVSQTGESE